MSYEFLTAFGEYIADAKCREMLADAKFSDLVVNKTALTVSAVIHFNKFDNILCLKKAAAEIKNAFTKFFILSELFYFSMFESNDTLWSLAILSSLLPITLSSLDFAEM